MKLALGLVSALSVEFARSAEEAHLLEMLPVHQDLLVCHPKEHAVSSLLSLSLLLHLIVKEALLLVVLLLHHFAGVPRPHQVVHLH